MLERTTARDEAVVAAVDLGASSGRVMTGAVTTDGVVLEEVHRFPNGPVRLGDTLHWDVLGLYRGVLTGLRLAGAGAGRIDSVGIDSWAVDYGLLDATGALLGNPVHYRDARTDGVAARVAEQISPTQLYATTGLQELPFNTIYQLAAARGTPQLEAARQLLLVPDLVTYWLTGHRGAEFTNASTTGLLDVATGTWSPRLVELLGVPPALFPPVHQPGQVVGALTPSVLAEIGMADRTQPLPVTAVGSHDTASAVVGVPAEHERFAYISCGTWSLVGVELTAPVLSEASRAANFTNEGGVDGTVRYLRNVMGLWLLQESVRTWEAAGERIDLPALLAQAAAVPGGRAVIDPDDPRFLPPGDMPARIATACRERGLPVPTSPAETARCILDSLAAAYRRTIEEAQRLSGREVEVIHVVGGGARNALLCQLTADACGLPVVAGPVEAAALGNVLVQARALGVIDGGLAEMRSLLRQDAHLLRYEPGGSARA